MHGSNAVIKVGILGVAGAGQFELLCGMGELESSIWMSRVWQQGALPLQQVRHALQELQEPEGQSSFSHSVQFLTHSNIH